MLTDVEAVVGVAVVCFQTLEEEVVVVGVWFQNLVPVVLQAKVLLVLQ